MSIPLVAFAENCFEVGDNDVALNIDFAAFDSECDPKMVVAGTVVDVNCVSIFDVLVDLVIVVVVADFKIVVADNIFEVVVDARSEIVIVGDFVDNASAIVSNAADIESFVFFIVVEGPFVFVVANRVVTGVTVGGSVKNFVVADDLVIVVSGCEADDAKAFLRANVPGDDSLVVFVVVGEFDIAAVVIGFRIIAPDGNLVDIVAGNSVVVNG